MTLQKKDFIEIEFTGIIKDTGDIFDSNIKEELDKLHVSQGHKNDHSHETKPLIYCLGEGMFLGGVDDYLLRDVLFLERLEHPENLGYMWDYSDAQLMQLIADHPLAKLFRGRQHCKTTCVLKIEGYESEERRQDRLYPVIGIPRDVLRRWSEKITDRLWLVEVEHELETELGLPQGGFALVVQPNFYEAVVPRDLLLYCYAEDRFQSLFERVPSHPLSLQEVADRAFSIRVAVDRAHMERAMKFDYLPFFQKHLGS